MAVTRAEDPGQLPPSRDYRDSREPKSLGPDGEPGHAGTTGLLHRRRIKAASLTSIGKEMNALEEQLAGLRTQADAQNVSERPGEDPLWQLAARALRTWPVTEIATVAGISERAVKRARAEQHVAPATREKLARRARFRAAGELRNNGGRMLWEASPETVLATYRDWIEQRAIERTCALPECDKATRSRGKYCSESHARNAADRRYRQRKKAA